MANTTLAATESEQMIRKAGKYALIGLGVVAVVAVVGLYSLRNVG